MVVYFDSNYHFTAYFIYRLQHKSVDYAELDTALEDEVARLSEQRKESRKKLVETGPRVSVPLNAPHIINLRPKVKK